MISLLWRGVLNTFRHVTTQKVLSSSGPSRIATGRGREGTLKRSALSAPLTIDKLHGLRRKCCYKLKAVTFLNNSPSYKGIMIPPLRIPGFQTSGSKEEQKCSQRKPCSSTGSFRGLITLLFTVLLPYCTFWTSHRRLVFIPLVHAAPPHPHSGSPLYLKHPWALLCPEKASQA